MNRLSLTVTLALFAGATAAQAQFGSGVVFDPTQSGHAIVQIQHEEQSLANEAQQIENGQRSLPTPSRSRQLPCKPTTPYSSSTTFTAR